MAILISRLRAAMEQHAQRLRVLFDRLTGRFPTVLLAAPLGIATGALGYWVGQSALEGCAGPPFSLFRIGVTFSARTFDAMLRTAEAGGCRDNLELSFLWPDLLFAVFYAPFLCTLYLWVERYRRYKPDRSAVADASLLWLTSLIVLLPFAAAVLDVLTENLLLYWAARRLAGGAPPLSDTLTRRLVWWGSFGAALKWTVLSAYVLGVLVVLLRGPRGVLFWRLRFSVLSVLVGGVALLVVPQGQDILQRLAEGSDRPVKLFVSVLVLTGTALVVWYYGRVLALARLENDLPREPNGWLVYYERNVTRMLGVAVLLLAGAAFARAGARLRLYGVVVVVSWLVIVLLAVIRQKGWKQGVQVTLAQSPRADLFGTLVAAALGALIVWPASWSPFQPGYPPGQHDWRALRIAAWGAFAASWLLYVFVYHRRRALAAIIDPALRDHMLQEEAGGYAPGTVPRAAKRITLLLLLTSGVLFAGFTYDTVRVARALGPLVVLSLGVANAVVLGSILAYAGRRLRLPLVAMLIALAAVFSIWNDNHRIRAIHRDPATGPLRLGTPLDARFRQWLAERKREGLDSVPVVLVAAAGGGLRAAYWSAASLAQLHDRDTMFTHHVFAISGVSGGSLGSTVFAATVRDGRCAGADSSGSEMTVGTCVRRFMQDDFLSPVLAKMIAPDFLQWFLPFPVYRYDRSLALERSWEDTYRKVVGDTTLAAGYLAFHEDSSRAGGPVLLLNTTHVQTGRRYVTAPFPNDAVFLDAQHLLRVLDADIPLSTAVHNSARFSYVSPAGRLDRRDGVSYGALVDGGYFENSGLATLKDLHAALREAVSDVPARFVVLYLCNDPLSCRRDRAADSSLAVRRTAAGEWLSPLGALLHTRDARGSLARTEMVRARGVRFFQLNVCDSLSYGQSADTGRQKVARERVVHPPLGWQLSRLARNWMDSSLTRGPPAKPQARTDSPSVLGASCRWTNAARMDSILDLVSPSD